MSKPTPKDTPNPERLAHTAFIPSRRKQKIGLQENFSSEFTIANYSTVRPRTVKMKNSDYSTLPPPSRGSKLVAVRSVDSIQSDLTHRFPSDMTLYLKQKLKQIVAKNQQKIAYDQYINSTLETSWMQSSSKCSVSKPIDHLYTLVQHKPCVEDAIDEAYLMNARERILRLISKSREKQNNYSELSCMIKAKCKVKEGRKKFNCSDTAARTIEDEAWDQQWRNSRTTEAKRYRNRLIVRCKREGKMFKEDADRLSKELKTKASVK